MKDFFERLGRLGILKKGQVDSGRISHIMLTDIIDLVHECVEQTSAEHLARERSIFAQSASLPLGGGRYPCSSIECRLKKTRQLAHFAVLYSDRVYTRNFLIDYLTDFGQVEKDYTENVRLSFYRDLVILNYLRPLIEEGFVVPVSPPCDCCPHCLANKSFGKDADKRLERAYRRVKDEFLTRVSVELKKRADGYMLRFKGPELLIEHGAVAIRRWVAPAEFLKMPRIVHRAEAGETVSLSVSTCKKINLHSLLASEELQNITFELFSSQSLGTTFLTERNLHIDILNSLSSDSAIEQRNYIAQKHLTSIVPFFEELNVPDVMKLRRREEEAFITYRSALNRAIDEYRKQGVGLTERNARAIYSDIIAPDLAKLDAKVKTARKSLVRSGFQRAAGWVGAISFGVYAGFVPPDLVLAAKALGFTKVVEEFLEAMLQRGDAARSIRNEEMYFLWKVREATRRSRYY